MPDETAYYGARFYFIWGGRRSALQLFAAQRGKKTVEGGKTVRCQLEHARVLQARFKLRADLPFHSVLRLLGPVPPQNVTYFRARDELVWSWLFCDSWNQQAYFDVLFDGLSGIVRTTQQRPNLSGWDGVAPGCGR